MEFDDDFARSEERPPDAAYERAIEELRRFIEARRDEVFFARQLEVLHERQFFHWITNRAVRHLLDLGEVRGERRNLRTGGTIHLLWHRSFRYYRRVAERVVHLVEEYADPNIGGALGLHGEALVLEGFARLEFVLKGRNTNSFRGKTWSSTNHDLDFVFSRDDVSYGVEVKNTLGYMDYAEFQQKIRLCRYLGVRPVFASRMMPKTWVSEVARARGFALILGYQLYPWAHRNLALRVRHELGLPVDAPRSLEDGTMRRFLRWHEKQM
ncbi:MAG TPA: hypothetical protein VHB47_18590 [Thermoanaerobaculia bacterium]|jgi:hypothetical protein|nr:hypothetical protein [Thermoanaerobaculia bacterium]